MLPRLLSFVVRAMAIAQLTQLNISIPAAGGAAGPGTSRMFSGHGWRVVSGTDEFTSLCHLPVVSRCWGMLRRQCIRRKVVRRSWLRSAVTEEDEMNTEGGRMDTTDMPAPIIPPLPGFRQFSWPYEDWSVGDDPSLFTFTTELSGWFPGNSGGLLVDMPSLPLSPIVPDSLDDSVTANMGSSREKSITPSEVVVIGPPVRSALSRQGFLDGAFRWLGKAHFWPSGRLPRLVRLALHALFEIPHIGPRTTIRHRENSVFP